MANKQPLRVAIIGTAHRSEIIYAPLLKDLSEEVELVSIWGRSMESAKRMGENLGVPWYTDLGKLVNETSPDFGIVCVAYQANGEVGLMAIESGLNVLLETPIAHKLKEAAVIIKAGENRGRKIEVAEQYHRRPLEQIKLELIESGLFGRVHSSFNDFMRHGYHGVSLMRSYLGFNVKPIQLVSIVHDFNVAPHLSRFGGKMETETQEHAMIEFESGQIGIYHWTDDAHDSAIRWWRSTRFLAEKGMGITVGVGPNSQEWLTLLDPSGELPRCITLEQVYDHTNYEALEAIVAHTNVPELPIVRWENPFFRIAQQGRCQWWHEDETAIAGCIMSMVNAIKTNTEPSYGARQAYIDQEIVLAINESAHEWGRPVKLPFDYLDFHEGHAQYKE